MKKIIALTLALALPLQGMEEDCCPRWTPRFVATIVGVTFTCMLWDTTQPKQVCACFQSGYFNHLKRTQLGDCMHDCASWCPNTTMSEGVCVPSSVLLSLIQANNITNERNNIVP
jgi:hypothetical protein